MKQQLALLTSLSLAALLSACGSGGSQNDDVTPPVVVNEVPASALASSTAFTNYAKTLSSSDSAEPVNVNNVSSAPTSETEAPMAI